MRGVNINIVVVFLHFLLRLGTDMLSDFFPVAEALAGYALQQKQLSKLTSAVQ